MEIFTVISLVGAPLCIGAYAWQRQWVMSLGWVFHLAHTIFSKVFPTVLPELVVTTFSILFVGLVLIYAFQTFLAREAIGKFPDSSG